MAEQIITKTCRTCNPPQTKPISEFYKHTSTRGGYRNDCKVCHCKSQKEYHQTQKGKIARRANNLRYSKTEKGKITRKRHQQTEKYKAYQKRYSNLHPEYKKAVIAVHRAIKIGKLPRPDTLPCHYCPAQAEQYHHHRGYEPEHYLSVVPACKKCHREIS